MLRGAWWMYAVLALWAAGAGARVYDRCELARELRGLGVRSDHIPTWVCIAFHESRFDTAARNPHSGDHGLLQISQLYWCGGGKACGLPCEALRDDDISDDVACALHVYEEHTRLQGDGFLAWVVYPQHCKHNTKKYLADCDDTLKNASTKPMEKSRALDTIRTNFTLRLNQMSIDELQPPYISLTSKSGHSRNDIENQDKSYQNKWQVTRFSNIDDLSLPDFGLKTNKIESSTISTFTLHDQSKGNNGHGFRNKGVTDKPTWTTLSSYQKYGSSSGSWNTRSPPSTVSTITVKPKQAFIPTSSGTVTTTTTQKPDTTSNLYHTTFSHRHIMSSLSGKETTTERFRCSGCRIPSTEYTRANSISGPRLSTTPKPSTLIYKGSIKTLATNTTLSASTKITTSTTAPSQSRSAHNYITSLKRNTTPNTYTSRSRTSIVYTTTPRSKITLGKSSTATGIRKPILITTPRSITTRSTTTTASSSRRWRTTTSETATGSSKDTRAAQRNAIFDLYLNTERPKLTTFKFGTQSNRVYRRLIFADGTTSPATPWKRNSAQEIRIK